MIKHHYTKELFLLSSPGLLASCDDKVGYELDSDDSREKNAELPNIWTSLCLRSATSANTSHLAIEPGRTIGVVGVRQTISLLATGTLGAYGLGAR
jgi:hypothetical protein